MRNLNTLRNGLNRFRFSEFYTIGLTPVLKNSHVTSSRLYELNTFLKSSLPVYKSDTQAQPLITEYFRIAARRCNPARVGSSIKKTMSNYVRTFTQNVSHNLSVNTAASNHHETTTRESTAHALQNSSRLLDFSYLQQWPPNFDYFNSSTIVTSQKINESTTLDSFVEFALSFNWYKSLAPVNPQDDDFQVMALIGVKDSLSNPKVKSRNLPAKLVIEIHDK